MSQINFKQVRDLGATLEAASFFIKDNFIKILKPTLTVVIFPLLLGSIMMFWATKSMFQSIGANPENPAEMFSSMWAIFPGYLLIIISFMLVYVMYIGYIKLYADGQEDIDLSDLIPVLKSKTISLTLSSVVLLIVIYIGMIFCFFPGIYLLVALSLFFIISIVEDKGFGGSWERSFQLVKGEWWSCFGLYIVTYLISSGMLMIVYIPMYVIMGIQILDPSLQNDPSAMMDSMTGAMSSMAYITPLYYLMGLVIALIFSTVVSLRYYSLVEKKEGISEKEIIEQL